MNWQTIVFQYIPITTIAIGIIGYFGKYFFEKHVREQHKKLEFLDRQLNEFYGPLYTLTQAGKSLFDSFKNHVAETKLWPVPCIENKNAKWRLWVEDVFMPLNEKIEKIILESGHLADEDAMPYYFSEFLIHSAQYKIIINDWKFEDFSISFAEKSYPAALVDNIELIYKELKRKQEYLREKILKLHPLSDNTNAKDTKRYPELTGMVSLRYLMGLQSIANEYKERKLYFTALYYLYLRKEQVEKLRGQAVINEYRSQLWADYENIVFDYMNEKKEDFCLYIELKKLTGFINCKISSKSVSEDECCYLFEDSELNKPIEKEFKLYEEVEILETSVSRVGIYVKKIEAYDDIPEKTTSNTLNSFCFRICTQEGITGWISGTYLWFFPSYMKKDGNKKDMENFMDNDDETD